MNFVMKDLLCRLVNHARAEVCLNHDHWLPTYLTIDTWVQYTSLAFAVRLQLRALHETSCASSKEAFQFSEWPSWTIASYFMHTIGECFFSVSVPKRRDTVLGTCTSVHIAWAHAQRTLLTSVLTIACAMWTLAAPYYAIDNKPTQPWRDKYLAVRTSG